MSIAAACAQSTGQWRDASEHQTRFIQVDTDVRLEVLDWGGTGPSVVLLAGSGNTAHVFDGFAEKLARECRVIGITRRGFGESSHPKSGYSAAQLGADVGRVLDQFNLQAPVLMGHSYGGQEMTALVRARPERIRGLVYIDSTADPTFDWEPFEDLRAMLPASMRPQPSAADRLSFQSFRDWQLRSRGFAFPESELRSIIAENPDGSIGRPTTEPFVHEAIGDGMVKPEFSHVNVPVLALFVLPAPVEEQVRWYMPQTDGERQAIEQAYSIELGFARRAIQTLEMGVPGARVVELRGAKHHAFLSNEADVLRETRAFLDTLP